MLKLKLNLMLEVVGASGRQIQKLAKIYIMCVTKATID